MLADGLQRSAMASSKLFLAGVAIVDGEEESPVDVAEDLIGGLLSRQGDFESLSGLGMNGISVEIFQLFGRRRRPGFDEVAFAGVYAKGALRTQDFDRQCIEEFVGEEDRRNLRG